MKVFYFITKSQQGGAQTVVFELLKQHKVKNDTVVVMAEGDGWLAQKTRELGYQYVANKYMKKTYNPFVLLNAALKYRKAVKELNPDVVSCHSSFSGLVGRVSLWNRYPVVYTAHGWGFTDGTSFLRKAISILGEKFASYFCVKIICVSHFDERNALRYHIAPHKKISVIYNGVSVDDRLSICKEKEIAEIVFVARFALPKQQKLLLEAYMLLPKDTQNKAQITFVGDGPLKQSVLDYSIKNKLNGLVNFVGGISRDGALDYMQKSDIFVLLSLWEGMPMSVLEALQIGLPVVVSDVCGISEIVDPTLGFLVSHDAKIVANALETLILDFEKRKTLSSNAQIKGKLFGSKSMGEKVFAVYNEICNK